MARKKNDSSLTIAEQELNNAQEVFLIVDSTPVDPGAQDIVDLSTMQDAKPQEATISPSVDTIPVKKDKPKKRRKKALAPFVPARFREHQFATDLKNAADGISFRELEKMTGVSVNMLYRAEAKKGVGLEALISICNWLEVPVTKYIY